MNNLILFIISVILTVIAVPVMMTIVRRAGLIRKNFKGSDIPAGFGFIIFLAAVPLYIGMIAAGISSMTLVFAMAVIGFGIIGLIDDIYGTREAGGFKGHLGLLKKGKVSTGLIKALVGGLIALYIGAVIAGFRIFDGLLNGLIISLAANTLNLLDLRPGRAVSCFWGGLIALIVIQNGRLVIWSELIPVLVSSTWLTLQDRSARVMMGDAGSNALGAVLGVAIALETGIMAKVIILVVMVFIHIYAEKYSISRLIESNRVLRSVDRLLGER
ncbi:MAG: glycosyltransferase [Armatimonadota bacterium]